MTHSSSGGRCRRSDRTVSESMPRARRAGTLLPANRSAFTATARSIGMPFQWVISVPTWNVGEDSPAAMRLTT
ncbi:hypothetical protein [Blastococcus sp. PRF04-17]|uniref:hypothetical protein n=1 Tax=Blastococcus sp. PRF04-17 TaxID=2933797 RepID=UPI00352FFAE0